MKINKIKRLISILMLIAMTLAMLSLQVTYAYGEYDYISDYPEVKFTNNNRLFESDEEDGWFGFKPDSNIEISCILYVEKEITIGDFFFSTWCIPGVAPECNIEFTKFTTWDAPTIEVVKRVKAGTYTCPKDNPFIHNDFEQLTGATGINLTLGRGVYFIHITPLTAIPLLTDSVPGYDGCAGYVFGYGVCATGTKTGGWNLYSPEEYNWLGVMIDGVYAGKSYDDIKKEEQEITLKALNDLVKEREEKAKQEAAAYAAKPITLKVNGNIVKTDSPPVIEDGRTLAPVRAVVEALGYVVAWDSATQMVDIYEPESGALRISMKIGSKMVKVSTGIWGVMDEKTLEVPAKIIKGSTMVPVRFIAETLGCKVDWDEKTKTVSVTANKG